MKRYCRDGVCLSVLGAMLLSAAGCGGPMEISAEEVFAIEPTGGDTISRPPALPAASQQQSEVIIADPNQPEAAKKWRWLEAAKADAMRFPDVFLEDSADTFLRKDNIALLLMAGGASIAMHNSDADDNIAGNFRRHRTFHGFGDEALNTIGSPASHFPVAGLWYALSVGRQDELNRHRAWVMIRALSVNGLVTLGLKAIRGNETPNGKSWAWPSGHTSSSFTVASVLDEFYGPKVGIPAYAAASVVAWRMMDTRDHWASDCVFGATLGWVIGHTIAGKDRKLEVAGFDVVPFSEGGREQTMGIGFLKRF